MLIIEIPCGRAILLVIHTVHMTGPTVVGYHNFFFFRHSFGASHMYVFRNDPGSFNYALEFPHRL